MFPLSHHICHACLEYRMIIFHYDCFKPKQQSSKHVSNISMNKISTDKQIPNLANVNSIFSKQFLSLSLDSIDVEIKLNIQHTTRYTSASNYYSINFPRCLLLFAFLTLFNHSQWKWIASALFHSVQQRFSVFIDIPSYYALQVWIPIAITILTRTNRFAWAWNWIVVKPLWPENLSFE